MKLVYDPSISTYDFGPGHPFRGNRFPLFIELIQRREEPFEIVGHLGDPPSLEDLLAVHSSEYLDFLRRKSDMGYGMISMDTPVFRGMWEAAMSLVHSSLSVVRVALDEGLAFGFGGAHHAGTNYGGGFCLINDIAVAVRWAQREGEVESVAIFDHDAHHGNGTMDIFYEDDSVLYISIHQDPTTIYPGVGFVRQVGKGRGEGFTVNIPLPPRAGPKSYQMAFEEIVKPIIESFNPDLLVAHGGSDPHFLDPLTQLGQTLSGLWSIGKWIFELKARFKAELLISGYHPEIRNWGWLSILRGCSDLEMDYNPLDIEGKSPVEDENVIRRSRLVVDDAKEILSRYWKIS